MRKVLAVALAVGVLGGYAVSRGPVREPAPELARAEVVETAPARQPQPRDESHSGHPITAERERLQRELQLVGALNDAVDLNDVKAMRRLIELYREHDPSDEHKLQEGYARIADCLQEPGLSSRERAQRYYDTERASTLRRYVRRACFER